MNCIFRTHLVGSSTMSPYKHRGDNIPNFTTEIIDSSESRRPPRSMNFGNGHIFDCRHHNSNPREVSFASFPFSWKLSLTAVLLIIAPFIHFLARRDYMRTQFRGLLSRQFTTRSQPGDHPVYPEFPHLSVRFLHSIHDTHCVLGPNIALDPCLMLLL